MDIRFYSFIFFVSEIIACSHSVGGWRGSMLVLMRRSYACWRWCSACTASDPHTWIILVCMAGTLSGWATLQL